MLCDYIHLVQIRAALKWYSAPIMTSSVRLCTHDNQFINTTAVWIPVASVVSSNARRLV